MVNNTENEIPLVSVIMANYNTPKEYLEAAIDSVLQQTYCNFEFIIVDDGSTNDSISVIESYSDDRIILIKNEKNFGLTRSLNIALSRCNGEYIARMDSDDISFPQRFEEQVKYLQNHENVIVCGTGVECIGAWEKYRSRKIYCYSIDNQEEYKVNLLFANSPILFHPSAMFNRKLMLMYNIKYDEKYLTAMDYKMWVSCVQVADCKILPEILLYYRIHEKSITVEKREEQNLCRNQIIAEQLERLHLRATDSVFRYQNTLAFNTKSYDPNIKGWIRQLLESNKTYKIYDEKIFKSILWEKWAKISYYGILNEKSFLTKIKILLNCTIQNYPRLVRIALSKWKNKKKKMQLQMI